MGLYARMRGDDESLETIPIRPFIYLFKRSLNDPTQVPVLVDRFFLTTDETTELASYLQGVGGVITSEITDLVAAGSNALEAEWIAKLRASEMADRMLTAIEAGLVTEAEVKAAFGVL